MNLFDMFKPKSRPIPVICPNCHKEDAGAKNVARRIGGTIGALAGAASGVSGILSAARLGLITGAPAGPVGAMFAAIAAATLRGIVGATIGCEVGTVLGGLLDKHVLETDACRHCGYAYAHDEASPMDFRPQPWPHTMAFPMGHGPDDLNDLEGGDPDDHPHGSLPSLT